MFKRFIRIVHSSITAFIGDTTLPGYLHLLPVLDLLNFLTSAYTVVGAVLLGLFYYYLWLPIHWVYDIRKPRDGDFKKGPRVRRRKTNGEETVEQVENEHLLNSYPNGWYAILETSKLKAGQVKHVQALGENFAVMRTAQGQIHVLDAYCPHLGANLAVGGVVKGDCLECPFHGWQFRGEDGHCTHIPYSDRVPKSAVVRKWDSWEGNGYVAVWYHAEGEPPSWQIETLPDVEKGKVWYRGRFEYMVDATIQDLWENTADYSHVQVIHTPSSLAGSDLKTMHSPLHRFLVHCWDVTWFPHPSPEQRHMSTNIMDHSLKLFNMYTTKKLKAVSVMNGPGIMNVTTPTFQALTTATPLDPYTVKFTFQLYCPPSLYLFGGLSLGMSRIMFERDAVIWKHKRYMTKPLLVKEEEAMTKFRHWYKQFYSENSPKFPLSQKTLEW